MLRCAEMGLAAGPLAIVLAEPGTWSWLVAALIGACAVALWVAVARLNEIERRLRKLDPGDSAARASRDDAGRGETDLRRVEASLLELREQAQRLQEAFAMRTEAAGARRASGAERSKAGPQPSTDGAAASEALAIDGAPVDLAERASQRLNALGFERIVIVTPPAQFAAILEQGGELLVEARRDGAPCKGRVLVRGGAVADVSMQSAYVTFP